MVWVLLVSLLLLSLVALIKSMIFLFLGLTIGGQSLSPTRIFSSKHYIPVTKHIKPLKILILRLQRREPKKLLREGVFIYLFNQPLSQIITQPIDSLAIGVPCWCTKRGAFQRKVSQVKEKQVPFVKQISAAESMNLF